MNGSIRSMLGTMLQHLSALPVHMLRQVYLDACTEDKPAGRVFQAIRKMGADLAAIMQGLRLR